MNCGNYRGISIMNSLAKCYDYLLNNRLIEWFTPCREQAGAQKKRGCIEHIVTLRLVIDRCMRKKSSLFIAFIDFSKAYDRVPRSYLLNQLKLLGCGRIMLTAIASMYRITKFLLGFTLVSAFLGVKQGSPTSCFLFILFVDELVKLLKASPLESFLQWLHVLMLMDDTVIFATSRESLCRKLDILVRWCNNSGMEINEDITKFMAFNCPPTDREDILLILNSGNVSVSHCLEYTYLGAIFTSDGKIDSSVKKHAVSRSNCINKFIRFLDKNKNAPYLVKKRVFDACVMSSLLYGCEAWLSDKSWSKVNILYLKALKMLLGVRSNTTNDICLLESGYPSLNALVKSRQKKFFKRMISERNDMLDDPFIHSIRITRADNSSLMNYIDQLVDNEEDFVAVDIDKRKEYVRASNRTKSITYVSVNPTLDLHPIYNNSPIDDDYLRISFTRFRCSSHRLRIETGRWSRIEPNLRLCQCGTGVQSERHVLCDCHLVDDIKVKYGCTDINFDTFMNTDKASYELLMLSEILNRLER